VGLTFAILDLPDQDIRRGQMVRPTCAGLASDGSEKHDLFFCGYMLELAEDYDDTAQRLLFGLSRSSSPYKNSPIVGRFPKQARTLSKSHPYAVYWLSTAPGYILKLPMVRQKIGLPNVVPSFGVAHSARTRS
jgi:hypothetical protein